MSILTLPSHRPSFWARLAVWLGLFAVVWALVVPVSRLAEDIRTGKLGGVCAVSASWQSSQDSADAGDGSATKMHSHCELCGSTGVPWPLLDEAYISCAPGTQLARTFVPAQQVGAITGLPFSRAPPVL